MTKKWAIQWCKQVLEIQEFPKDLRMILIKAIIIMNQNICLLHEIAQVGHLVLNIEKQNHSNWRGAMYRSAYKRNISIHKLTWLNSNVYGMHIKLSWSILTFVITIEIKEVFNEWFPWKSYIKKEGCIWTWKKSNKFKRVNWNNICVNSMNRAKKQME